MTGPLPPANLHAAAATLIHDLTGDGATLAVAESLTGGQLVAALTSVPGASRVVRGAVIAYAQDVKTSLLGVESTLLDLRGPVCPEVAEQMARGVRIALGATYGLSTTGEAGPLSESGRPVGTVHIALAGPRGTASRAVRLDGVRDEIQREAVAAALNLLAEGRRGATAVGSPPTVDPPNGNIPV